MKKHLVKPNERLDDLQYNNLYIIQNPDLYSFTRDAVALANYCKAKHTDTVVDFCAGSGVIGILVSAKTNANKVILVEIQQVMSEMSQRSIELNNLQHKVTVINDRVQNVSNYFESGSVDVVVCNPPYQTIKDSKEINESYNIAISRHEIEITQREIIQNASKILKYGGYFYTINQQERLTDILVMLREYNLEPKEVVVLSGKKDNNIIMIKAKKGGKSGVKIKIAS